MTAPTPGPRCGTPTGRDAHRRAGTPPCDACRQARNEHDRNRYTPGSRRPDNPEDLAYRGGWRLDGLVWRPTGITARDRFGDVL